MADPVELVVDALAAFRLTRLVTKDRITRPARESWVQAAYEATGTVPRGADRYGPGDWETWAEHDENAPALAEFILCPWCVGAWIAAGVVAARVVAPRAWGPVARALATSAVTGLIASR